MKNKKKLVLTSVLAVIAIVVLIVGGILLGRHFQSKADGAINVRLVELDGTVASEKKIEFETGDTLVTLLDENYENVVVTDGMLMSIDTFTTASDWSTFISIYVDEKMSEVGILDIEFTDGTLISFVMTEFIVS